MSEDRLDRIRRGDLIAFNAMLDEALDERSATKRVEAWSCMSEHDERVRVHDRDRSVMVRIPGGVYPLTRKRVMRTLPPFWMSVYPITNAQYLAFMQATGYVPDDPADHLSHWVKGAPREEDMERPVVHVSMLDALHYCDWAGLELPGTYMWEAAAAGPRGERYPWGDVYPSRELAHIGVEHLSVVGAYRKTRTMYGCQGMYGNAGEWCAASLGARGDLLGVRLEHFGGASQEYEEVDAVARGYADHSRAYDQGCRREERVSVNTRADWLGFRPVLMTPQEVPMHTLWGELRSLCHEGGEPEEVAARLEYALATMRPGRRPDHEVATYLFQHLPWLVHRPEEIPSRHVLAAWLDGEYARLFRLLYEAPTEYMLYTRCLEQLGGHAWATRRVCLAAVELDRVEEVGVWLDVRARKTTCASVTGWEREPITLEQVFALAETDQAERSMEFFEVSLPGSPLVLDHVSAYVNASSVDLYAWLPEAYSMESGHFVIDFLLAVGALGEALDLEVDLQIKGLAQRAHQDLGLLYDALTFLR